MTVSTDSSGNSCTIAELQGHGPNQVQYVRLTCPGIVVFLGTSIRASNEKVYELWDWALITWRLGH